MALITCKECDKQISSTVKVCPHCGKKQSKNYWLVGLGVFILLAILGSFIEDPNVQHNQNDQKTSNTKPAEPIMPSDQAKFIAILSHAQTATDNAENEMQKGSILAKRTKDICALNLRTINEWVGELTTINSNGDGKGVIEITIADDITIKTMNNDFSDTGYNTLIEIDTPLFNQISQLKESTKVIFSGTFAKDKKECLYEPSLTLDGGLLEPEFIFKFTDVKPI